MKVVLGILIPFIGTTAGSFCVFFMKKGLNPVFQKILLGFAAGVMMAAAIWSLIIPSIKMSEHMQRFSFVPATCGIVLGMALLMFIDNMLGYEDIEDKRKQNICKNKKKSDNFKDVFLLITAIVIHNVPEGMAVGVAFAGMLSESHALSYTSAMALSIGIAIQNFPEGSIVSMPLRSKGMGKLKSFIFGTLSGAVEPVAAMFTILFAGIFETILPLVLSFAAGAMLFVVVRELIPEATDKEKTYSGTIGYGMGFLIMMILDVALG